MTSLVLALVLSASPQTFYVHLEPSSVYASWQNDLVAGAVAEVQASHGREAYTKHDPKHSTARFVLSLNVAQFPASAVAVVKVAELATATVVRSDRVAIPKATKETCVAAVRTLVRKVLETLPADLPPPKKPEK